MIEEKGLTPEVTDRIWTYVQRKGGADILEYLQSDRSIVENSTAQKGLEDMTLLFRYLTAFNILPSIEFNLSLARGLDYYTGLIYEVVTDGSAPSSNTGQSLQRSAKKETSTSKPPNSDNPGDEDRSADPTSGLAPLLLADATTILLACLAGRLKSPALGFLSVLTAYSPSRKRAWHLRKLLRTYATTKSTSSSWLLAEKASLACLKNE